MLVKRKQPLSNQQHQTKAIELFHQILSGGNEPSSVYLKYFALECLNEFSNSEDSNKNRVFCQLNRMGGLNQLILDNLIEIQLDPEFDLSRYLYERQHSGISLTQSLSQSNGASQEMTTGGSGLDETMNALMSVAAMDTTISGDAISIEDDDKANRDKIETIETDLRQLIESYDPGHVPVWLRTHLKNLAQFISKNV